MLRIDWANPKVTIGEFDSFLAGYLRDQYDGVLIADSYLYVRSLSPLNAEQESAIMSYIDNLNEHPSLSLAIAEQAASYLPSPKIWKTGQASIAVDPEQKQFVRGQILTDEGSFRDDFTGTSLFRTMTGTFTFDNTSDIVASNDADMSDEDILWPYIKKSGDSDSCFTQGSLLTKSSFNLNENYKGTSGDGDCIVSNWLPKNDGCEMSVAQSDLIITSSQSNSTASVYKAIDYLPIRLQAKMSISSRIAGQTIRCGVVSECGSIKAYMQFDGTDSSQIKFITSTEESEYETETSVCRLPFGITTDKENVYAIEVSNGRCSLYVNETLVQTHKDHVPDAYDILGIAIDVQNETIASSNSVKCCWVHFQNVDQIDVVNTFGQNPVKVKLMSPASLDEKPIVSTTSRPIGTYTYLSSAADSQTNQSQIANGQTLAFTHNIGDPTSSCLYFDVNAVINTTYIHTAAIQWSNADLDTIKCEIVPKVTTVTPATGTSYMAISGILVQVPNGYGNVAVDWNNVNLVEMVQNEFKMVPSGYWDADYNQTTNSFENITFVPSGVGKYNIFVNEIDLYSFVPSFVMLGSNIYDVKSNDTSQLGHNMRIKITTNTVGTDHAWKACLAVYLYRAKTC